MPKLSDAAREAQRIYMREWRKKNPDKVRRKNATYWEKLAQKKAGKEGANEQETAD